MQIQGSPITFCPLPEAPELAERFWHWRGASGKNYIHSVYAPNNCPPLPGAVYVGVKRLNGMRIAVAVGRFAPFWGKSVPCSVSPDFRDCDEVHVHLLAKSPGAAEAVCKDLAEALGEEDEAMPGLLETKSAFWQVAA